MTAHGLIGLIVRAIADKPEEVQVTEMQGEYVSIVELKVAPSDAGKVIGKNGRVVEALRVILSAVSSKLPRRVMLVIVDEQRPRKAAEQEP